MDLLLFARYKRGGGSDSLISWEFSSRVDSWESAPAPAQIGRRLIEGIFDRKVPDRRARLVNNITHWAYGILAGAQYGAIAGSIQRPRTWYGLPFGAGVWGASYVVLPAAGLYKPIWQYDSRTLAKDLSAHLLYGATTAGTFGGLVHCRDGAP
jgi:hypothetical protein